jgi:phenylalanyl-tRNA synthetase beta chain
MNISMEWLREYLPGALDAGVAGDALMRGGLPVEHIEPKGDDRVLDVEVTSNRGDCLSHVGVARELSALFKREFVDVKSTLAEVTTPATSATSVTIDAPKLCPHYTARIIRNVKVGSSPQWMVRRLQAIGLRSINNIVDVTNYVMFEMGQPLHAFDFDKLAGRKIIVREARSGETITSLDGHERKLSPGMLVIADAEKPVALAGVMGGLTSEVSAGTVNILLESARFDPLSVRRTARALAMKSDSSYRFERGIDPTLSERASARAAQLIVETAGGEVLSGIVVAGSASFAPKKISLRTERMRRLLGTDIPTDAAIDALHRLQLAPQANNGTINVTVPSWRQDLNLEVDLIEEVARVVGYEHIPVRDTISIVVTPPSLEARAIERIRSTLVSAGYFEAVTLSFVSDLLAGDFMPDGAAALMRADAAVRRADARLRPSLTPGLLEAMRYNEMVGTPDARLFEIGSVFWAGSDAKPIERRRLGLVDHDLSKLRGAVEALLAKLNRDREVSVVPAQHRGFQACGNVMWGGQCIGVIGAIDALITGKIGREGATAAELDLEQLIAHTQHVPQLRPLPRFPATKRDLSLLVEDKIRYIEIEQLIRGLKLENLESFQHVITYAGKPLAKGSKSVTVQLVFRSSTGTLTSEQVDAAVQRVVDAARTQINASLRA